MLKNPGSIEDVPTIEHVFSKLDIRRNLVKDGPMLCVHYRCNQVKNDADQRAIHYGFPTEAMFKDLIINLVKYRDDADVYLGHGIRSVGSNGGECDKSQG